MRLRERVELSVHRMALAASSSDFKQCFVLPSPAFSPHVQTQARPTYPLDMLSLSCLCGMCTRLILTQSTKVTVVRIMIRFGFTREANTSSSGESYASVCACDPPLHPGSTFCLCIQKHSAFQRSWTCFHIAHLSKKKTVSF